MNSQFPKDYDSSSPSGGLEYLDIPPQAGEMRYNPEATGSSLNLAVDPPHQSSLLGLYNPPVLGSTPSYPQDGATFYQPTSNVFGGVDIRSRLGSNTTQTAGMAQLHSHRTPSLPHADHQLSARDQYSSAIPAFKRTTDHTSSRSPTFSGASLRRNPLSPSPSPVTGFNTPTSRMDASNYGNRTSQNNNVPPLSPVQVLAPLHYADAAVTPAKVDIAGLIDKGFFVSDGDWTCYRRNYFSCVCSFSLSPHYPGVNLSVTPPNSSQQYPIVGFCMSISAIVADNDQQQIDLVQHTPKRDKGPTTKPEKVPMAPKPSPSTHHNLSMFNDSFGGPQGTRQNQPNEYTFERIQFKQATQNNGKRRAAQQYYHLNIELWADLGQHVKERFVKVAVRKSARMIVRGRSPGHYQTDRRGSQSSGSHVAANITSFSGIGAISDFNPNGIMGLPAVAGYGSGYDTRPQVYTGVRHHEIPAETMISSEDEKALESSRGYHYYPGAIYDGQSDRIGMFTHRPLADGGVLQSATGLDNKVKAEYDQLGTLPRSLAGGAMVDRRRCGPFESKPSSNGFYPNTSSPPGLNFSLT